MKNLITLLFVLILPFGLSAQTKGEKLYQKYADKENVMSFSFGGSFLPDLDLKIDEDGVKSKIKGSYKNIKFLSLGDNADKMLVTRFKKDITSQLSHGGNYKEVLLDKDNKNAHFYAKGNGKEFSEFHVLSYGNTLNTTLISFYGNFTVEQIKILAKSKM